MLLEGREKERVRSRESGVGGGRLMKEGKTMEGKEEGREGGEGCRKWRLGVVRRR